MLMPISERDQLIDLFEKNDLTCQKGTISACYCSQHEYETAFPDLTFFIGGQTYHLPKESYVI